IDGVYLYGLEECVKIPGMNRIVISRETLAEFAKANTFYSLPSIFGDDSYEQQIDELFRKGRVAREGGEVSLKGLERAFNRALSALSGIHTLDLDSKNVFVAKDASGSVVM